MKIILPLLIALIFFLTSQKAFAESLEVSKTADFSSKSLDFNGGDMIFVRVMSSSVGSRKSQLNLRDNQYNLVNTFNLEREGSYYSTALPAPYSAGYYSLEAKIESEGSNSTSVKTIKVGNSSGASVKVNVKNKVEGINSNNASSNANAPGEQAKSGSSMDKESPEGQSSQDVLGETTTETSDKKSDNFFDSIVNFCKKVFDIAWPF